MVLSEDQRINLVVALLAGYSYSLEKAWILRARLRSVGLANPETIVHKDVAAVGNLMKAAGYDRGGITYIIAPRLISLMVAVQSGQLDGLAASIHNNDEAAFCKQIEGVKGFGPTTAQIAWMLLKNEAR